MAAPFSNRYPPYPTDVDWGALRRAALELDEWTKSKSRSARWSAPSGHHMERRWFGTEPPPTAPSVADPLGVGTAIGASWGEPVLDIKGRRHWHACTEFESAFLISGWNGPLRTEMPSDRNLLWLTPARDIFALQSCSSGELEVVVPNNDASRWRWLAEPTHIGDFDWADWRGLFATMGSGTFDTPGWHLGQLADFIGVDLLDRSSQWFVPDEPGSNRTTTGG